MPKIKTHQGTKDRMRVTKTGKVVRRKAFSNHFLQKKSSSRKRQYSGTHAVEGKEGRTVKRKLGDK